MVLSIGRPKELLRVSIAELDGKEVAIHRVTGRTVRLWQEWRKTFLADPEAGTVGAWDLAHAFAPELSADEVQNLTSDSARRIIELATMDAEEVEKVLGEGQPPTGAAAASNSPTPSPIPSPG